MIQFITGDLLWAPRRVGKPLRRGLEGRWAARRGSHRVLYAIDDRSGVVAVLAAEHRPWLCAQRMSGRDHLLGGAVGGLAGIGWPRRMRWICATARGVHVNAPPAAAGEAVSSSAAPSST